MFVQIKKLSEQVGSELYVRRGRTLELTWPARSCSRSGANSATAQPRSCAS